LPDVYAETLSVNRPYDAILDVFLALPPVPAELHAFASALHAAVAFSRATLSALDIFAASAGVGTNAMPLTSTVAIMPGIKVCGEMIHDSSFELPLELLVLY
jgi:hypothetical protein